MEKEIRRWLEQYAENLLSNDIEVLADSFTVPSTMSTPEYIVIMKTTEQVFEQVSSMSVLAVQNGVEKVSVTDVSVFSAANNIYIVNCNWKMINKTDQIFAEFGTVYHLIYANKTFKILNATSYYLD